MTHRSRHLLRRLALALLLCVLLLVYVPTLQTIPNGSDHFTMVDVGETQVVLNVWGTLHATGYPHYVMASAALVAVLRAAGVSAAAAPALTSLIWGVGTLVAAFALFCRLGSDAADEDVSDIAAGVLLVYGLSRLVWLHHVIAEIYTFGWLILVGLLALAFSRDPRRVYWLALLGGLGVAHHRAIALAAPALIFAAWGALTQGRTRPIVRRVVLCAGLALVGFVPYAYLPLRAASGAAWVYGDPTTFDGFRDEFMGREAEQYMGVAADALSDNLARVGAVVAADLTPAGVLLGVVGLVLGVVRRPTRRAALTFALLGGAAFVFHVLAYRDILVALILPATFSLAAGWLFGALALLAAGRTPAARRVVRVGVLTAACVGAAGLFAQHQPFIVTLTRDQTGIETARLFALAPRNSTVMLAWGTRHSAVGFARDVLGIRPDVTLVDHNADFAALLANENSVLVTPAYTFYNHPRSWWEARLNAPVYPEAADTPPYVRIVTTPRLSARATGDGYTVEAALTCSTDRLRLRLIWSSAVTPERDESVFVHLRAADGQIVAQADQSAPVFGVRPTTGWLPGEQIADVYDLPRLPAAETIRFGLYHQAADGTFVDVLERTLRVESCDGG